MGRTLLVAHHKTTWRDWIKDNLGKRELLVLDPAFADHTVPARVYRYAEGKVREWRFIGTTDPQRNPLPLTAAAAELARYTAEDALILTFPVRLSPVLRQIGHAFAQILQPEQILVPAKSRLELQGWPVGAEPVELPDAFPALVRDAQRRSRWIELLESCEDHTVELADVMIQGSRLGSGLRLAHQDFSDYGEVSGGKLHIVTDRTIPEKEITDAMDICHATSVSVVSPSSYNGLLCSFAHQNGEDFGMGVIQEFDPERNIMKVKCNAVAPAPVRVLKIGNIRVSESGQELDPPAPWSV